MTKLSGVGTGSTLEPFFHYPNRSEKVLLGEGKAVAASIIPALSDTVGMH